MLTAFKSFRLLRAVNKESLLNNLKYTNLSAFYEITRPTTYSLQSSQPKYFFTISKDNPSPAQQKNTTANPQTQQPSEDDILYIQSNEDWVRIIETSQKPLVLDCYADWCQPCRKLTPILEEKVKQAKGKWTLVKMNIDENPQLTTSLKIRSVPTVVLISGKNVVDGFTGLPSEEQLNTFFGLIDKLTGTKEEEARVNEKFQSCIKMIEEEKYNEAVYNLNEILKLEAWLDKFGARAVAAMAYSYLKLGDKNKCLHYVKEIKLKYSNQAENEEVKKFLELIDAEFTKLNKKAGEDPKLLELEEQLAQDPTSIKLRYDIAQYLFENDIYEKALEYCLQIMKIDRNWEERKAHKLMLQIFDKLGSANPAVVDARKQLQRILY